MAIDAVYHTKCLVNFYNRARRKYSTENVEDQSASQLHAIAFAEVVSYIEGFRECQETVPVFPLVELGKMYCNIIEDLRGDQTARLHTVAHVVICTCNYMHQHIPSQWHALCITD